MSPILGSTRAVVLGALVAVVLIALVEAVNGRLYPLPAGLDINNREAMSGYIATLPLTAFLVLLLGYALGALGGGYIAARLAPTRPMRHAGVIMILLVLASLLNLRSVEHPVWFWVANLVVVVGLSLLGGRLAPARG
jgi:hypothetical protein